jgi:hypothetical protein
VGQYTCPAAGEIRSLCFFRFEAAQSRRRIPPPEAPEKTMSAEFDRLLPVLVPGEIVQFKCVDLPTLIKLKRAAGRPKHLESLAELEALLREQEQ